MKQTAIRKVSKSMAAQKRQESQLTQRLLERCQGLCEICGQHGGLVKHEIIFRGRQGDPLDPLNVLMICPIKCHNHIKYPKTGTPLTTEEQLEIARCRKE